LNVEQFHLLYHCPISFLKIILPLLWRSQRWPPDKLDLYKTMPEQVNANARRRVRIHRLRSLVLIPVEE
jgi:hypothetical protein